MTLDPRAFKGLSRFLAPSAGGPMADRALAEKLITPEQMHECVVEQDRTGRPLDEILVGRGFLKAEEVTRLRQAPLPLEVTEAAADPLRNMDHYVLVSLLGVGGMAEVWKSWDRSIGRWVAVKYLKPDIGHPTQRIEREGRMAGGLSHPNIISIYERGHHDGRPYLVMPYVEGATPKSPLPPREAARIALAVTEALEHAHGKGVIHRDIKPANIIVDAAGRVFLMDFGLAIPGESATSRWAISGTPEYASPEQIRGDQLDPRTDLYSLGATLYHFLAGRPPFAGKETQEIADQVLHGTLEPPEGAPRSLARVILKAMDRDPSNRFPTAADLSAALRPFVERPARSPLLRASSLAALALAVVLSSGGTYLYLALAERREERELVGNVLAEGEKFLSQAEVLRAGKAKREAVEAAARQALTQFNLALRLAGGFDPRGSVGQGRSYEILGQEARSQEAYLAAVDLPAARLGLGRIWLRRRMERRTGSDWAAQIAHQLEPLKAMPQARVYLDASRGRWAEVLASGTAALDAGMLDEMVLVARGAAAVELGKADVALPLLAEALEVRPKDPLVLYLKGRAHALAGAKDSAREAFTQALAVSPRDWPLREDIRRELIMIK